MTQTIDEQLTTRRGEPARHRSRREGVQRSLLRRIRAFHRPQPDARPWRGRPDEAYGVLEDARVVITQGWVQDRWFARRPAPSGPRPQFSRPPDRPGEVTAACLVGAVVCAAHHRSSGDLLVKAGPALDYLWDAWQETRGLGGAGIADRAAPRELRMARVRDLTRWNDQPGRTREDVLGLIDLAAGRAVMAAMRGPR